MGRWELFGLLCFLLFLQAIGLYYYAVGFFLTRYEMTNTATAQAAPKPQFKRAVLLLVDALRFDFAHYDEENLKPQNFQNKLKVIHEALNTQPQHSRLFEFIADPPTATMQRIKGMTTGSLPTFIDFRDNFASDSVAEDNLISQLKQQGHKAVFMGDDTWVNLYPSQFYKAYPFDSFNVKDLHTVDEGVINNIFPEMQKDDWTLIIGHMLGVDHVGHRYYSSHPAMADKLTQVDGVIRRLMEEIDEETLLLVFGDHGMTDDGNHGGATRLETNAALFAYSKRPFAYDESNSPLSSLRSEVFQIDLVPTLSLLLGVPVPFNSLGSIIPELFVTQDSAEMLFYLNARQVFQYISTYDREVKKLPEPEFEELLVQYDLVTARYSKGEAVAKDFHDFIRRASEMCRSIWTTFDLGLMTRGLVVMFGALLCCCLALQGAVTLHAIKGMQDAGKYYKDLAGRALPKYFPGLFVAGGLSLVDPMLSVVAFVALHLHALPMVGWRMPSQDTVVAAGLLALHGYGLFSNSYILKEDQVHRFLLVLLIGYLALKSDVKQYKWHLICAAAVRATALLDPISIKERINALSFGEQVLQVSLVSTYVPAAVLIGLLLKFNWRRSPLRTAVTLLNSLSVVTYWLLEDTQVLGNADVVNVFPRLSYVLSLVSMITLSPQQFFIGLLPSLVLVSGENSPLILLNLLLQLGAFTKLNCESSSPLYGVFLSMTSSLLFFTTGHRSNLPSLQIKAAFTGFEIYQPPYNGILLSLNTFSCSFIVLAVHWLLSEGTVCILSVWVAATASMTLTALNTAVNRRHLMVWSIFAPKFLFNFFTSLAVWVLSLIGVVWFY
jgi:phosphatidylinositol glycan class O